MDIQEIKNLINPKKQADKTFFLSLLDSDEQLRYENERITAVMSMLKAVYLNKLKSKIAECNEEKKQLSTSEDYNAAAYRRVAELNALIAQYRQKMNTFKCFFDEPYFARMDLVDEREGYNSYYIGKKGDEKLEIVDWRAPLARKYYQKSQITFSINDYDYKLILRRALRTKSGKLTDYKNEYLSLKDFLSKEEIAGRDEEIIFDPFLKEILKSRKEKQEITDIIETIQEKQYEIITMPERSQFVLQGVAGSGKTMILLHRLSYLMYNNEDVRPSDVLVITPSDSFNAFIDELAAILELEKVKTSTINNYFLTVLKGAGLDIAAKVDYEAAVDEKYLQYVYSENFTADVKKRLSKIFDGIYGLFSDDSCAETVESVVHACENQQEDYVKIKNAGVRVRRCVLGEIKEKPDGGLYYTKPFRQLFNCVDEVKDFLKLNLSDERMKGYAYFYRQLLSFYKSVIFIRKYSYKICRNAVGDLENLSVALDKEISDLKRYKINVGGVETFTYADRINRRAEAKNEIDATISRVERIKNHFSVVCDFADVVRGDPHLTAIGKCESKADILKIFYRETVKKAKIKYGVETKKILRCDPFSLCVLLSELGFDLSPKYSFVFVDEAQDISLAEYSVLKRANGNAAFNIFGDLQQNVTSWRGVGKWENCGLPVYEITLNYRNTNEIVDFVSKNLNIEMQSIGFSGEEVSFIEKRSVTKFLSQFGGLKAVITSESNFEIYAKKIYNVVRHTGKISKTKINVMTVYESKGLEFTAVAVADGDMTDNEKYVAYTRALKILAVIR